MNPRDKRWQEWLENENYNTPPPRIQPRKSDFIFHNYGTLIQPLFIPVLPGSIQSVSSCHFHHDHPCGSSARYRKIKARPYRSSPSVRVWPYPSGIYPPVFPFFGTPEEIGHLGNSPYQDELTEFMPCGQPGILLGQIIPEEISSLILDLEHEKMQRKDAMHNAHGGAGGQTTILVDDSFLKNGKNS
jgi:hypothetical protein